MYNGYLMKVTSVFTRQKGPMMINSLGPYSSPSCLVSIKSWRQASNQKLLCPCHVISPLWNITGLKPMWPHPSYPSSLSVFSSCCSRRCMLFKNKKEKVGTAGLPGIRKLLDMMWKSCVDLLLLGFCLILQEIHDLLKGHLSIYQVITSVHV